MTTLLGYLARFATFSGQGEVLCTQGLTYLLNEYGDSRSLLSRDLSSRTGLRIGDDMTWLAEAKQPDGGKPDLEARVENVPVIKIEAKLDAAFAPNQLQSYVSHLRDQLQASSRNGLLVVLVPPARTASAIEVVKRTFGVDGSAPWRTRSAGYPDIVIIVMSWVELLTALESAEDSTFRSELAQFRSMYLELVGAYIAPLALREDLTDLEHRKDDFVKLVDRVTRRLTTQNRVLPMTSERLDTNGEQTLFGDYVLRYVCAPAASGRPSCFSVGVRHPFAGSNTAIWLRFHHDTGQFRDVGSHLKSSALADTLVDSGRHLWLPLRVSLDAESDQMVDELVAQVEAIRSIAYPLADPAAFEANTLVVESSSVAS